MKYNYIIVFLILILLGMFINGQDIPSEVEIRQNLTSLEDSLLNITNEAIPYTSFYENEPNIKDGVYNIAHGMFYNIMIAYNTIIPTAIYSMDKTDFILKILFTIVIIWIILKIPWFIKWGIIIYFFKKEKKRHKEKMWH